MEESGLVSLMSNILPKQNTLNVSHGLKISSSTDKIENFKLRTLFGVKSNYYIIYRQSVETVVS